MSTGDCCERAYSCWNSSLPLGIPSVSLGDSPPNEFWRMANAFPASLATGVQARGHESQSDVRKWPLNQKLVRTWKPTPGGWRQLPQLPDAPASSARPWAHQQGQRQCLHRRSSKVALGHHSWLDSLQAQPLVSPLPCPPPGFGHILMVLGAQTCTKDQPSIVGLQVLCVHRGGGRRHLLSQ